MFSSSLRAGMMMEMEGASVDFFGEGLNHLGRPRMSHNAGAQRMATPGKISRKAFIGSSGDRVTLDDAVGAALSGEDHHGHAAAGVGAAAGEDGDVEVAEEDGDADNGQQAQSAAANNLSINLEHETMYAPDHTESMNK